MTIDFPQEVYGNWVTRYGFTDERAVFDEAYFFATTHLEEWVPLMKFQKLFFLLDSVGLVVLKEDF